MKIKLPQLIGILVCLLVFTAVSNSHAESSIKLDSNPGEGIKQFFDSLPPENDLSKSSGTDLERVFPFSYPPYLNFKITFNDKSKQNYAPGETVSVDGKIIYSCDNAKSEIDKVKEDCLKGAAKMNKDDQDKLCRDHSIYQIPRFNHLNLLVQVWKIDETSNRTKNGDFMVDEFYAQNDFSLINNQENPLKINWKVPQNLGGGKYYFSIFANLNKQFPVLGFTPDIFAPVNQYAFNIQGNSKNIYLDKDNIEINNEHYYPINRIPTVKIPDNKVDVKTVLRNPSSETKNADVIYKLFRWTEENENNVLEQKDEKLTLNPNENKDIEFSFTPQDKESFYTLQITTINSDQKSVENIHLILENKNKGIFIFIGEAEKDSQVYPYICLRNAAWVGNFKGKIKLTATSDNKQIGSWEKDGYITPQDGNCFVLKGNGFENLKKDQCTQFNGEIRDENGNLVDKANIDYACSGENSLTTKNTIVKNTDSNFLSGATRNTIVMLLFGISIVCLISALTISIKHKNKNDEKK